MVQGHFVLEISGCQKAIFLAPGFVTSMLLALLDINANSSSTLPV